MKKLYVLLMLSFVLVKPLVGYADKPQAPASDRGGGGGNIIQANPAQPASVVAYISDRTKNFGFKTILRRMLYNQEYVHNLMPPEPKSEWYKATSKLFGRNKKGQTVYDVLNSIAKFYPNPTGCVDERGVIQDSTAFNPEPNTICFWPEDIARKSNEANLFKDVAAQAIHELSHYMDCSEREAVVIQQQILYSTREGVRTNAYNNVMGLRDIKYLEKSLSDVVADVNSGVEDTQICARLGFVESQTSTLAGQYVTFLNEGASALTPKIAFLLVNVMPLESSMIEGGYCMSASLKERIELEKKVDNDGYAPLSVLISGSSYYDNLFSSYQFRLLRHGDKEGLLAEVAKVQAQVESVKSQVTPLLLKKDQ